MNILKIETDYSIYFLYASDCKKIAQVEATKTSSNWLVTRLIVPPDLRGQGIASRLMQELTAWADFNNHTLILTINPYRDLNYQQLKGFYEKYKFVAGTAGGDNFFIREPQVT